MNDPVTMLSLFGEVLDLCKVQPGETLIALTERGERQDYADAFVAAAGLRDATAYQINLTKPLASPSRSAPLATTTALTGNRAAIDALKAADIVIDLVGLLWSAEQKEIQAANTRILMVLEPIENIIKMFPTEQLRHRVEAAERRLAAGRELRITSPAGTDVTYRIGNYPVITQYGYTDQPGRWDHLPGGFLYTGGDDDGVNGVVVIDQGDIIFPFKRHMSQPIRLTIEKGWVTAIEGAHQDAEILRAYIARFNDPRAYAVSHIGWGMDEKAQWDFLATSPLAATTCGVDGRSFYGNVLFSTGPNNELGGSNDTACHLDIPLRNCDLFLDGEQIVQHGHLVPEDIDVAR